MATENIDIGAMCLIGLMVTCFVGWFIIGCCATTKTEPCQLEIIKIVKLPNKAVIYTRDKEFEITKIEQYNKLNENSTNNISFIRNINMYGGTASHDVKID